MTPETEPNESTMDAPGCAREHIDEVEQQYGQSGESEDERWRSASRASAPGRSLWCKIPDRGPIFVATTGRECEKA